MKGSADARATKTSCLYGVVRRFLCTGSPPTHPSDQLVESNKKSFDDPTAGKCLKPEANVEKLGVASSPGVVAKLMGLDSFPDSPLTATDRTNLGSYFRSRSANSIDFLTRFDPLVKNFGHPQHGRVRTSVSFREGLSDDCSFVPHLEKVDENEEYQEELIIKRRPQVSYQQSEKEKKRQRSRKKENLQETKLSARKLGKKVEVVEERRRSACVELSSDAAKNDICGKKGSSLKEKRPAIKPVNCKEASKESKCKLRKKKKIPGQHKVLSQCSLTKVHPAEAILSEEDRGMSSRKFLPSQIANSQRHSPCPHFDDGNLEAISKGPKGKSERRKSENKERCNYKRMAEDICRLTEEGLEENWRHGMMLNFDNSEEICREFGHGILQSLLEQLVDELVLLYGTRI